MSRNIESMESILNNGIYDGRYSMNMKTFEGRNHLKTITDSIAQSIDRQDSLMLCQQLQEQDGFDFMDQSMDLTPYLRDLRGIDDGGEDLEPMVDKQRMLECDIQMQHGVCECTTQYADLRSITEAIKSDVSLDDASVAVPEASGFAANFQPVKMEIITGEREVRPTISVKKNTPEQIHFTPTIKPRKYSLKPEAEKKNPLYRLKREKNNDAVRRSRTKAKQQQKMKDEQIKQLQRQITEFGKVVNIKDEQIVHLENAVCEVEEENRHLRVENMRLKSELYQAKKRCSARTV
uniref:BZIP domain-containing protein n=1 Tax=Wuchereria bancrofti TaxID=6293 RepID=A0AAF5PKE8_WUCBA